MKRFPRKVDFGIWGNDVYICRIKIWCMDKNEQRSLFLSGAAKWGLVFALICLVYDLVMGGITRLTLAGGWWTVPLNILSFLLWAAKFTGLIILFKYVLEKYFTAVGSPQEGSNLFGYGVLLSVLSGLVYGACYLVYNIYIVPDAGAEMIALMRETYAEMGMLSPAMDEGLTQFEHSYPSLMFFTQIVYNTIWGLILSAIFTGSIKRKSFFAENA